MSAYSDAVMVDTPAAYWRLGETSGTSCTDSSGNGKTGTLSSSMPPGGTASLLQSDVVDGAITFDYSTTLGPIRMNTTYTFTGAANTFTTECWIRPVDLTNSGSGVDVFLACGSTNGWAIYYAPTTGVLHWVMEGGTDDAFTYALTAGVTTYLVFVCAGTNGPVSLYVNGVFSQATGGTGNLNATTDFVTVGAQSDGAHKIKAAMDEVALYSGALSAARITAHYNAARATALPNRTAIPFTQGAGGGGLRGGPH